MKTFPKGIQFAMILFSSMLNVHSAYAIAVVESRGEPLIDVDSYTPRSAPLVSQSAKRTDDRLLQTINQIENLKQEISDLRGTIEIQDHEIKQLKKSQQDLYLDLEKKIGRIQNTKNNRVAETMPSSPPIVNKSKGIQIIPKGKENIKTVTPMLNQPVNTVTVEDIPDETIVEEVVTQTSNANTAVKPPISPMIKTTSKSAVTPGVQPGTLQRHEVTSTEKEAFDMAYQLVTSKQYDMAVSALQDFLTQHPKGNFAPNANYWLGEIHMVKWQNDHSNSEALETASRYFTNVSKDFPHSAKVSDSLLKLGLIAAEKGDSHTARRYFTDVKMQYPNTAAARVAEKKLHQQ